ncbi:MULTISPECIES: hypothetical protein [unclassified Chryseobacterium]|uniref:beta strand repeat-containing protein n=1 Tax=unclassified Chryseobacterium TaxID=2593645 RepID=UPI0022699F76|nr:MULTISPECIES: hypothetical protein [unclassified Chryseobacterium]
MKKTIFASLLFLGVIASGQVGIKTTNPKATLDVTAHDAGLGPTFGIKTSDTRGSWDNIWFKLDSYAPSINASGAETGLQFNVGKNTAGTYGDNNQILTTVATMTPSGTVGIGTEAPATNALLELSSTTKGFLPTRMTTAQRDAINPKHEGLVVYNLDTHCLQFWNATEWIGNCTNNGGGTNPGTGSGTIANCTTGALSGTYQAGTAMNSSNTVVLTINVTQVGTVSINSNTVNGVTFSGSQNFTTTGTHQITLTASGTPAAAGNHAFTFSLGSNTCSRTITFASSGGAGTITNCTTGALNGTYTEGTAMNSSNTIQLTVNATQTGAWSASSATVNGVTFSGSGTFTSTGSQTITLTANGTPSAAGSFGFTFSLGSSTCSRNITFNAATGAGTITNCTTGALNGTYQAGTAMNSSNTIQLTVNATQTGNWTASSATVNGVTFSGSGTFTSTGSQTITLTANGTPSAAGNFNFTFSLGSSTCSRSITFTSNNGAGTITNCTTGALNGTYKEATAMNSSNTIQLTINATQTGNWTASSATVNGVTFSGSGTFTSTGSQTITLTASGTPSAGGTFGFTFTLGSSTCSRNINFEAQVCQFGPNNISSYTTNDGKVISFTVNHNGETGTNTTGWTGCGTGANSIYMPSFWLLGRRNGSHTSTTTTVSFNRPTTEAVVALAELDASATGGASQSVTITAQDANGNNVPVTLTKTRDCTGNNTISGNTVSQTGTGSFKERNTSLSIKVSGGYYRTLRIVHNGVQGTYRPETNNATAMNLELCGSKAQ